MSYLLLALKYHDLLMFVVRSVEQMIPDDTTVAGPQKLDMALKSILAIDATLVGKEDDLKKAFSMVKTVYNAVRAALPKA
jgi:hypothetical protein